MRTSLIGSTSQNSVHFLNLFEYNQTGTKFDTRVRSVIKSDTKWTNSI